MFSQILSAKQVLLRGHYGAMRRLGLRAEKSRRRLWIVGDDEAHFFDLAHERDLQRFREFEVSLFARAEAYAKRKAGR